MSGMNVAQPTSPAETNLQDSHAVVRSRKRELRAQPRQLLPQTLRGQADTKTPQRPKNTKSRNGCITCKARRRKCDEAKPACSQCTNRKIVCGGYSKNLRWKEFGNPEQRFFSSFNTNNEATKKSHSLQNEQQSLQPNSSGERVPFNSPEYDAEHVLSDPMSFEPTSDDSNIKSSSQDGANDDGAEVSSGTAGPTASSFSSLATLADFDALFSNFASMVDSTDETTSLVANGTTTLVDELDFANLPEFDFSTLNALNEQLSHASREYNPIQNGFNFQSFGINNETLNLLPEFQLTPSVGANREGVFSIYQNPQIHGDSPENIAILFDRRICEVLCIKENPNENPWRKIVWPLAKEHASLYHAIAAMTCFQASNNLPQFRAKGIRHLQNSMQMLPSEGQSSMHLEAALTVAVALGFAETWYYPRSSTGISHIKRAKELLQKALSKHLSSRQPEGNLVCLSFLANTWIYMDVITRITCKNVQALDFELMTSCNALMSTKPEPGFQIDPLMGCAETLFPLLGRVADLVTRVRGMPQKLNSPAIVSKAVELKTSIERWSPSIDLHQKFDGESLTSTASDLVQTANAYKWATLLLLYQAVPELPSQLSISEMAQKVLILLATVPLESRAIIFPVFPLMVAGCEATEPEDRDWVRNRWHSLSTGNSSGIVDRCLELTLEVWRRRDFHKDNNDAHQKPYAGTTSESIGGLEMNFDLRGNRNTQRPYAINQDLIPTKRLDSESELLAEFTVKSKLHWMNVMKEWGWEVMLG